MCGTTTVIYKCGHSKREVLFESLCAIGISYPDTQWHWGPAQGIVHNCGLCNLCQWRLARYGCLAPNQLEQLQAVTKKAQS